MNRKGAMTDLFVVIIVALVLLLFIVAWMVGWGLLTDAVTSISSTGATGVNVSQAGEDIFGQVDTGLEVWHWAVSAIIFAMFISIFISNFLIKAHPVFLIAYICIVIVAIIFSVVISNAYEATILTNSVLGDELDEFTGVNFIFLNLPIWITVIGFLGAIFLFIGITRDKGAGESISI